MIDTWHQKKLPALNEFNNLENKFMALCEYLEIDKVVCVTPDLTGFTFPPALDASFYVSDILGPRPNYIKSLMNEWLIILAESIENYLQTDIDYDDITECLQKIKSKAINESRQYNYFNDLTYKGSFSWLIEFGGRLYDTPNVHLNLDGSVLEQLRIHFNLRMNFFSDITNMVTEKLDWHLAPPEVNKAPADWESEHAKLEIAEFLESIRLTHRLKINNGSSPAKFLKEFYGLFGMPYAQHHQKLQQIRKRKDQPSYLHDLAKAIEEDIVKLK